MRTSFPYLPVVHHDDLICALNGFKPVSNGNYSATLDKRVDGFLHFHFIFGVQRGGRFVKQDDLRIFQDGTGNGYALLFSARKGTPSFAYQGVISFGQPYDEIMATGFFSCGYNFFFRRVSFTKADIIAYGVLKQTP